MAWERFKGYIYRKFITEGGEEVIACLGKFKDPYGGLLFFKDVAFLEKENFEEISIGRLNDMIEQLRAQDIIEIVAEREKFERDLKTLNGS